MLRTLVAFVVVGMVMVLLVGALTGSDAAGQLVGAVFGLVDAVCETLRQVAELDHAIDEQLWNTLTGGLRVVLGALKCLGLLLMLLGLLALNGAARMLHRWL